MEEEQREHAQKMKKMEADMEQVFEAKVNEKRQKLAESEVDVSIRANSTCKKVGTYLQLQ